MRRSERWAGAALQLVCASGWPTDAVHELLEQLRAAGATLRYHGDFDLAGVAIFRRLERIVGGRRWCYDADAYERALALVRRARPASNRRGWRLLRGLELALRVGGREIPEELLLHELTGSLSRAARREA